MFNYIDIIGICFPAADANVPPGGDPTVYGDIVWNTAPIAQATLEACSPTVDDDRVDAVESRGLHGTDDILVHNGVEFESASFTGTPSNDQALVYDSVLGWTNKTIAVPPGNSGRLVQVKFGPVPAVSSTTTLPAPTPTITDGTQVWTDTITPTEVTSLLRIACTMVVSGSNNGTTINAAVFRDSTLIGFTTLTPPKSNAAVPMAYIFYDVPNTTSPVTYSCRVGKESGATWYVNSAAGTTVPAMENNSYTVEEIGL